MKNKLQIIKIIVPVADAKVDINAETDTHYDKVTGVFFTASVADAEKQSTLQLKVDDEEIFPEDFEVSLINPTSTNALREVSYKFEEAGLGSRAKGTYVDGGNATSYPYEAKIYLEATQDK